MSLQPPGVAQLSATSTKARARWGLGRETQGVTNVELVTDRGRGWKGFPGTGTEGGMCLEANPAVL